MKKILITGIGGFVGSHLTDLLLEDSTTTVVGLAHPTHDISHFESNPLVSVHREDILDEDRLAACVKSISPDEVYHIAGMAHVHESWINRKETILTNFLGTLHVLEACRALPSFPRVLLVGSGECYGIVPEAEQPISEDRSLAPSSPYAVSKIAQEMLGIEYACAEKLPVYMTRSFNHTGPRQKESFVCSAFARQIAMAELGLGTPEIRVGNLSPRRDFSDVRDVCRAYQSILQKGTPGVPYNVCSGTAPSIDEILNLLLSRSSMEFRITVDPERFRPVDMPLLLGTPQRLQQDTGWKSSFSLERTLQDLLNYWRDRLRRTEKQ